MDVFYLSRARYVGVPCAFEPSQSTELIRQKIEDEYKKGNLEIVYKECNTMLQDPTLPFYYRGHYHLILSRSDEDPVSYSDLRQLLTREY